ncbi:DUF4815 domain-containing protein [uncultured Desulfovibrio sp.]|uniref:DUF4815 domain-containing protein n=1 Tax=uncultured Desulfovibrio sp. TaxID=167968 RepID=UPI00261610FE|nr:DUF4815 domain-containing protein [uncultured Desulfovibrio sp.]
MSATMPDSYYNTFDAAKNHESILFRDGYTLQGAELNALQSASRYRLKGVADALFKDGDIIRDAQVVIDKETGAVQAGSGAVYLKGAVRGVPAAEFTIPVVGTVAIGVRITETVISELEDPTLYNPAIGSRGEGEPGAWRLRADTTWGYDGDNGGGEFYPVYTVDDGIVRAKDAPPTMDAFTQGIAKYDRDSTAGGSYVVSGLTVLQAENDADGNQVYTLAEGRARVNGYGVDIPTSRRLTYPALPDLRLIDTEVHIADASSTQEGGQRITLAHPPLHHVDVARITTRKTVTLTHGAYSGAQDALPDTAVVAVVECRQGETVYASGVDYRKNGDKVDWSLAGAEPATGSTYLCTYDSIVTAEPTDVDFDGFSIEGAVTGSSILVTYKQALPRIDRLALNQEGQTLWFQGVAAEMYARAPVVPAHLLPIATVNQTWRETRSVVSDGVRVVPFDEIETINRRIDYALAEIARQRLEADVSTRESGARVGIFVDPLLDDSMRDQGLEQNAAILNGSLQLPIQAAVQNLPESTVVSMATFTPEIVLAQLLRTGSMQVNPYMAFDALPARASLNPAIDQWTDVETDWTSAVTKRFDTGHYVEGRSTLTSQSVSTSTETVASKTRNLEYLRQISVAFQLEGFGPGEVLRSVLFDGIAATFNANPANDDGVLTGSFLIPARVPAGAKTVVFRGNPDGGSWGSTVFVGQGQLTVQTVRQVHTVVNYWVDPLAQTFVLDETAQICGVDLWFTAKSGEVRVQIREVQNGVPARVILAEAILQANQIVASGGGHTRALFDVPVQLLAGAEYAVVVLCNDATTALAIAEMGKFDSNVQRWVTSQPYTVGVLLSSSNASTWTAHQDKDLAFRLLKAAFAAGASRVEMGSVAVENLTDMLLLAVDEAPSADSRVEYEIALPDGNSLLMAQGQAARLPVPVSGEVAVAANLQGSDKAAPLLWPGAQLLTGTIAQSAEYYSRSIPAVGATKAALIYDAEIPSGASVTPHIRLDAGEWATLTATGNTRQGDGQVEYRFQTPLADVNEIKIRLTLTGTSAARPIVRNIRLMAVI